MICISSYISQVNGLFDNFFFPNCCAIDFGQAYSGGLFYLFKAPFIPQICVCMYIYIYIFTTCIPKTKGSATLVGGKNG